MLNSSLAQPITKKIRRLKYISITHQSTGQLKAVFRYAPHRFQLPVISALDLGLQSYIGSKVT